MAISVQKNPQTSSETRILTQLAAAVGDSLFALWFGAPACIEVTDTTVRVWADSEFELRRIQRGFTAVLRRIVNDVVGEGRQLEFLVRPATEANFDEVTPAPGARHRSVLTSENRTLLPSANSSPHPLSSTIGTEHQRHDSPSPAIRNGGPQAFVSNQPAATPATSRVRYRVTDFYFGAENEFVRSAIRQVLERPGQLSPLLLCGATGTGKTHLLEAVTNELRNLRRLRSCIYMTAEQFTSSFVHALRGGGLPVFRKKYRDLDVLAIDDIQFFGQKRATIAELQYTLDHLIREGKQIILSSDRTPLELTELGPELLNRISGGLICNLQYVGEAGRQTIVQRFCGERQLGWTAEICREIAVRIGRDARRLSGAINRVYAAALAQSRVVDVSLVQEVLGNSPTHRRLTSIANLEKQVCDVFGLTPNELRSASRKQRINQGRMVAMYLARQFTNAALSDIGEHFGGRSHSTVIASLKRVDELLKEGGQVALASGEFPLSDAIAAIESRLQ